MPRLTSTTQPEIKPRDIPALEGLRALSIGLVILGHAIGFRRSFVFRYFFVHAELGVRIFFIISGFLITTLLLSEKATFGNISLKLFYIRRALRILPAFCVFVATVFILSCVRILDIPSRVWLFVLTYTVNFGTSVWVLGHLWSLSVEEQFYLLWPVAVRFASSRKCSEIAALAIFSGIFIRALFVITGIQLINPGLRYAFPFVCGPIAMGCLLAIGTSRVYYMLNDIRWLSRSGTVIFVILLVFFLDTLDLGAANRFVAVINNVFLTFCIARFVFIPDRVTRTFLNNTVMKFIGRLSYSLYLWQQLFFEPHSTAPIRQFPLNLCATFVAASLSYFLIETRFLCLRKRFRRQSVQELGNAQAVLSNVTAREFATS